MSAIPELPRATILAWRAFSNTPAFQEGIDHLRRYHCPQAGGSNEIDLVKSAIGWNAYTTALNDIEDVLMKIKKSERSIDEPSLHEIRPDKEDKAEAEDRDE